MPEGNNCPRENIFFENLNVPLRAIVGFEENKINWFLERSVINFFLKYHKKGMRFMCDRIFIIVKYHVTPK